MATTIVRARPPSKCHRDARPAAEPLAMAPGPVMRTAVAPPDPEPRTVRPATKPPVGTRLSPGAALRTFRKLAAGWNLREDRAWIMLTGDPAAPRALTAEQAERVALLVDMDAAISRIVANVGAWLIDPNPGPLLAGRSPLEFLTRAPTPGYATLLRQARRWAEM